VVRIPKGFENTYNIQLRGHSNKRDIKKMLKQLDSLDSGTCVTVKLSAQRNETETKQFRNSF